MNGNDGTNDLDDMHSPRRVDPTTALLVVLTAVMAVTVLAVVYLVVFVDPGAPASPTAAPADAPAARCDASRLETMTCPAGHYCNIDRCEPMQLNLECREGESCRDCDCQAGLVCHHNTCIDQDIVERVPLTCRTDERLARAVKQLALLCASRKRDVGDLVSTGSCSVAEWEQLALDNESFDLLLAAFPNRFAVHFPISRPSLTRRDWPSKADREFVLDRIRAYRGPLAAAKQIFVIGRASPDGDPQQNHMLALARMNLVSEMINTVVHEGLAPTERDALRVRIRSFTLPASRPINPAKYMDVYLANPEGTPALGLDPLIAWDRGAVRELHTKLADKPLLAELGSPEHQKLFNLVNRVVLVIPIPCLGDEYDPPKTDLPRPTAP